MPRSKLIVWLGRTFDRGLTAAGDLMVKTIALRGERNAWVRSIDVSTGLLPGSESDAVVTARYVLGGIPEQPARPLFFNGLACPFPILRFESDDVGLWTSIDGRREPLLPLETQSGSWNGASFALDILWPRKYTFFVLPHMLPYVIGATTDGGRPNIMVHRNGQDDALLAGVPLAAGELGWGKPLAEAVLLRGHAMAKGRLVLTERLATEFDQHQIERSGELVNLILGFLERELGVPAGARVAARAGTEHLRKRLRGGSCIVLEDDHLGVAAGNPNDLVLAFQLASVWWGGGCQVAGRRQDEIATGMCLFLALRWLQWMEPGKLPPTVERLREFASWKFLKSRSYALEHGSRGDVSSRTALALYDHAERSPRVMDVMRQLTREAWGKRIPVDTVLGRFQDVGVPIRT